VGLALLKRAYAEGALGVEQRDQLVQELQQGRCAVHQQSFNGTLDLERIVSLVTLRLQQGAGTLHRVARWDARHGLKPGLELPGCKRATWELPPAALERLLASLDPLASHVRVVGVDHRVEHRDSMSCGVHTKYVRTEYLAELAIPQEQLELPQLEQRVPFDPHELGVTLPRAVFALASHESLLLCCWLTEEEASCLGDHASEGLLLRWLSCMDMEPLRAASQGTLTL